MYHLRSSPEPLELAGFYVDSQGCTLFGGGVAGAVLLRRRYAVMKTRHALPGAGAPNPRETRTRATSRARVKTVK